MPGEQQIMSFLEKQKAIGEKKHYLSGILPNLAESIF